METIRLNLALFIRLLELVREDIKGDEGIHYMAEIVSQLAKGDPLTMSSYPKIIAYLQSSKML